MLEQYKKTFWGVQALVLACAAVGYRFTHQWFVAVTFVAVMELCSVFGAMWATRIKHKLQRELLS